jgi:nitroreductase
LRGERGLAAFVAGAPIEGQARRLRRSRLRRDGHACRFEIRRHGGQRFTEVFLNIRTKSNSDAEALELLLSTRHSCRGFLPDPVADDVIARILHIARRTPSWCNAQPWRVVITKGAATERFRAALGNYVATNPPAPDIAFPREYHGVYLERRRACGFQLYEAVGIARGDREASAKQGFENYKLFGAPHVAIVTSDEALGAYGALDCGAYVNNFLVAAQSLGVASIPQAALASHSKFVREHFRLGDDRLIVCGISFGYEDPAHKANTFRTSRASLDEVVEWVED